MTKAPGIKLLIFVLVTSLTGFGVATVVGNMRFGSTHTYQAVFSNASGLGNGEDVKVGGVPLGKVKGVELASDGTAVVSFSLSTERPLTEGTTARIKYKNLIGDRYVELSNGPVPSARSTVRFHSRRPRRRSTSTRLSTVSGHCCRGLTRIRPISCPPR